MDTAVAKDYQSGYKDLLDYVDQHLDVEQQQHLFTPSFVAELVVPIAQAAATFRLSLVEDSLGTVVPAYIDNITNPTTGACKGYDSALGSLKNATGGDLSPFPDLAASDSISEVLAMRSKTYGACLEAGLRLNDACAGNSDVGLLCERADDVNIELKGAFDSCLDSGLRAYYDAVTAYNAHCAKIGYDARYTRGPVRRYFYFTKGISMDDCFRDKTAEIGEFFAIFIVAWAAIIASFWYARRSGETWLAACDVTMDVSRSRAFTVTGTLWLLYFFYRYNLDVLSKVRLNNCTGAWPDCSGKYFPFIIYVFIVCFMWIAAFSTIFIINNPYRRRGPLLSITGVALSHYFTFVVARQCLQDLDLRGNTPSQQGQKFFEICLICVLQVAMDICYLHVVAGCLLGWKTFNQLRGEAYTSYIVAALSRGDEGRIFITCALPEGVQAPDHDTVGEDLATWAGGRDRVVLVSVSDPAPPEPVHLKRIAQLQADAGPVGVAYCVNAKLGWAGTAERNAILRAEKQLAATNGQVEDAGLVGAVYCVEAVLVSGAEERAVILRAEEQRAATTGRVADAARLRLERERAVAESPRATQRNARLLAETLRSELFGRALEDPVGLRLFAPVIAALHQFCRATAAGTEARAKPETRLQLVETAAGSGLTQKQMELLCCLPEAEVAKLSKTGGAGTSGLQLKSRVDEMYRTGREELARRLESEPFISWINEGLGLGLDAQAARASNSNPFSPESAALDAFLLGFPRDAADAPAAAVERARVSQVLAGMLSDVRGDGGGGKVQEQGDANGGQSQGRAGPGIFGRALGLSDRREQWDAWANSDQGPKARQAVAFVPSILFVCVGIATIIIMSSYVEQVSFAVGTRDVLYGYVTQLRKANAIFQNMALGTVNLASCVDPMGLRAMKGVALADYITQLQDWDPITAELDRAKRNPELLAAAVKGPTALQALIPKIVLSSVQTILANVTQPDVLATLPVYGPTGACLYKQYGSQEVQNFINGSLETVNTETSKVTVRVPGESRDSCRCSSIAPTIAHARLADSKRHE